MRMKKVKGKKMRRRRRRTERGEVVEKWLEGNGYFLRDAKRKRRRRMRQGTVGRLIMIVRPATPSQPWLCYSTSSHSIR